MMDIWGQVEAANMFGMCHACNKSKVECMCMYKKDKPVNKMVLLQTLKIPEHELLDVKFQILGVTAVGCEVREIPNPQSSSKVYEIWGYRDRLAIYPCTISPKKDST